MKDLGQTSHQTVLVTGAAGYIGSHTMVELLRQGYAVVAVDNHCNSHPAVYERVQLLAGRSFVHQVLDVRDDAALSRCLAEHPVDACIHFAALKAVGDSMQMPVTYLNNNVSGLLSVLAALQIHQVKTVLFSSSATVYGEPETIPVIETAPLNPTSVYGTTKLMGEQILQQLVKANAEPDTPWRIGILRYFNPVGAHPSGQIGEAPQGIPNNLMPYVAQTAAHQRSKLSLFGADYPTPDGTCIRDYIHIQDVASGHVAALEHLLQVGSSFTVNLGTGQGTSVKQLIETFARVNNVEVPYEMAPRRLGDVARYFADPSLAHQLLGWRARHGLEEMCRDAWRWQCLYPCGYN